MSQHPLTYSMLRNGKGLSSFCLHTPFTLRSHKSELSVGLWWLAAYATRSLLRFAVTRAVAHSQRVGGGANGTSRVDAGAKQPHHVLSASQLGPASLLKLTTLSNSSQEPHSHIIV